MAVGTYFVHFSSGFLVLTEFAYARLRLTAALRPGKLKKVSGPCLWGIWFNTDNSLIACLGCKEEQRVGVGDGERVRERESDHYVTDAGNQRHRGGRVRERERERNPWKGKKTKHGVTSHLYHTGSITLQSPLPCLDNSASIPWQPLIDLSPESCWGKRNWKRWCVVHGASGGRGAESWTEAFAGKSGGRRELRGRTRAALSTTDRRCSAVIPDG